MLSRMKICGIVLVIVCVFSTGQTWSQEAANVTPDANVETAATAVAETTDRSNEEIPFSVLQQIVSGFQFNGEIKTDLSKEQIEAMKKVQSAKYMRSNGLHQLTLLMSTSSVKNRRFNQALTTLKAENEAELQREWLAMITPEQQASIRRRNRTAIMQASLNRQQTGQSLLYSDTPVDALMTNNDLMSVIERPAIQDLLELTDEQFEKVEELQLAADVDAVSTLRLAIKSQPDPGVIGAGVPTPSPAFEQLQIETLKILTADQVAEYNKLLSNPAKLQELLGADGIKNERAIFGAMMPHGVPIRVSTTVVNGKAEVNAEFSNTFASPVYAMALKITEEQQVKIAELLKNSRDALLAEMATRTDTYNKQQNERAEKFSHCLTSHNEKFHAQVVSLITPSQMQKLEKERLKGIGLWALRKSEVRSALELTEEQIKSVEDVLTRRPKQLPMVSPTIGGDFQKESEAFHKRARENGELFREHIEKQNQDLQKLLTESQQNKFIEMTGYRFTSGPSI